MSVDIATVLVERVRPGVPTLVDRIAHRIRSEIPFYAAGGADEEDLRSRLRANVHASFDSLLGVSRERGPAVETGRLRARQNAPLADVLSAYRLGYTMIWAAIVQAGRAAPRVPPDPLIDLAYTVFDAHNRDADALIEAYRDEAQYLAIRDERERAALIDALLTEELGMDTLVHVSRALRLPLDGSYTVVVAATDQGKDPMPRVASALSAAGIPSVWRVRYETVLGVVNLQTPLRNNRAIEILTRHATGPVGVSPVFASLRDSAGALELARLVLRQGRGAIGVEQFDDTPLNLLLVGGREIRRNAAAGVLGELLDQSPVTRDVLLQTLHAWVEAGGSADRTGEALHCHPNTIRKRLRRLENYTGRSLGEPAGIAEVVASALAWRQIETAEGEPLGHQR